MLSKRTKTNRRRFFGGLGPLSSNKYMGFWIEWQRIHILHASKSYGDLLRCTRVIIVVKYQIDVVASQLSRNYNFIFSLL